MLTRNKSARSLKLRLLVRIVLPLMGLALVLGGWRTWYAFETAKDLFDRNLTAVSLAVARDLASSGAELLSQETLSLLVEASGGRIYYHVYGPEGAYVAGFGYPPRSGLASIGEDIAPRLYDSSHLGRPVRAVTLGQFVDSSGLEGVATITVWQEQTVRQSFAIWQAMSSGAIIAALVAAVSAFVWFGVNSGLAPLTQLRGSVARRSPQDLRPIGQSVPEEVQPLVNTLNNLFMEVQHSIEARDRFIGNAAHQLRNPIAAVRAQAESALSARDKDEMTRRVERTLEEVRHTSTLAEQLLMLERLRHSPGGVQKAVFDVGEVLLDVATRFGDRAMDQGLEFSFDSADDRSPVMGDADLFGEAFENLLDNAMVHGGPALRTINLAVSQNGSMAEISVRDDGRGIPIEDREVVFERFVQLDFGRGSGLGLAIAKEIVTAHGATITVTDGLNGCGVGFVVEIELEPVPPAVRA